MSTSSGIVSFPVILFGVQYWAGLVDWLRERVAGEGKIATTDLRLFTVTDSPREAVATVRQARERRSQAFPIETQSDAEVP